MLTRLVMTEKCEEAIAAYDVRFVTKAEDSRLKAAEQAGAVDGERYVVAAVMF